VFYTLINDKKIDACIKKAMKDSEYIQENSTLFNLSNKEFYKTSLRSIFKFIKKCNEGVKNVCCGG